MNLIAATLDVPEGLEDFLAEPGADGWASSGGAARVDQLGLNGFLQKLVDMSK